MARNAVLFVLETFLYLFSFAAGSFLPVFVPAVPVWQIFTGRGRVFVLDGLFLALAVYLLVLALEAVRGKLRIVGTRSSLAILLAVALGLAMRFGFKSI